MGIFSYNEHWIQTVVMGCGIMRSIEKNLLIYLWFPYGDYKDITLENVCL
jgi:hypothetical protein